MKRLIAMLLILVFATSILFAQTITVWEEDFDSSTSIPEGWHDASHFDAVIASGIGVGDSNAVLFHGFSDWNMGILSYMNLITPVLLNLPSGAELVFDYRFMEHGSTTTAGTFYPEYDNFMIVICNDTMDDNSFENIWSIEDHVTSTAYRTISVSLDDYDGQPIRVAFQNFFNESNLDIHIDNVRIEAPTPQEHDLRAYTVTGIVSPTSNMPYSYMTTIRNVGSQTVASTAYTVSLYMVGDSEDTHISTLTGMEIAPTDKETFTFIWTPSEVGTADIYAKIIYNADDNQDNNQTSVFTVYIQPEGEVYVGNPASTSHSIVPFIFFEKESLVQTLYYADELVEGEITSVGYMFTRGGNNPGENGYPAGPKDVKIWMKQTNKEAFANETDAEPFTDFILVYEGTIPVHFAGEYEIRIDLDTPFIYDKEHAVGANLIIMTQKMFDSTQHDFNNLWHTTTTQNIARSLLYYTHGAPILDVSEGYPDFQEYGWYFANTAMTVSSGPFATVTGSVTDTSGAPISGATIAITGSARKVLTDASGNFTFRMLPAETLNITASRHGFLDSITYAVVTTIGQTSTCNIQLSPHPKVTVSGTILASDSGAGLGDAVVKLNGYDDFETTTGSDSSFTFAGVYDNLTYTITVSASGFDVYSSEVTIEDVAYAIPPITLQEILLSPRGVRAQVNPENDSETIVSWFNPLWETSTFSHARPAGNSWMLMHIFDDDFTFTVAHRYSAEQLASFQVAGYDLYKVDFMPGDDECFYTVKVWVTDDNSMPFPENIEPVCSVPVTNQVINQLKEVLLPINVPIPENGQIFVGLEIYIPLADQWRQQASFEIDNPLRKYSDLVFWNGEWEYLSSSVLGDPSPAAWLIYLSAIAPEVDNVAPVIFSTVSEPQPTVFTERNVMSPPSFVLCEQDADFGNLVLGHRSPDITRAYTGDMEVYRMLSTDTAGGSLLSASTLDYTRRDMQYIDTAWGDLNPQVYKYAVKTRHTGAEYPGGFVVSDPVYSNNLIKAAMVSLTMNVAMQGGSVAGAVISLSYPPEEVPDLSYTLTVQDNGTHTFPVIYHNIPYDVTVEFEGSITYKNVHQFIENATTININLLPIDRLFEESFDRPIPNSWTNIDADGDGFMWDTRMSFGPGGASVAYSSSVDTVYLDVLYPDNWLISPPVQLLDEGFSILRFMVAATFRTRPYDRLLIYIAPVNDDPVGWESFLEIRNQTGGNAGNPDSEVLVEGAKLLDDHILQPFTEDRRYYSLEYDITEFAGQEVRLAIRHAFCEDQFAVLFANFVVGWAYYNPINISGSVVDGDGAAINGAVVTAYSTPVVHATTNASGEFTLLDLPSDATYTVTIKKTGFADKNVQVPVGSSNLDMGTIVMTPGYSDDSDMVSTPKVTALKSNYPNPFNPATTIAFDVACEGRVVLNVYNIKGQRVTTLVDDVRSAGSHKVVWNGVDDAGRAVSSGIYFYRMQTEGYTSVKKMLLMK